MAGIRQLCEQFPTHLNEVCLQGFAALVNSARDVGLFPPVGHRDAQISDEDNIDDFYSVD